MNEKQLIDKLREKAASDAVASAVLHMFALRRRTRNQISVEMLRRRMKREGYSYTSEQLRPFIVFLAKLGLGQVVKTRRGTVSRLKDIKLTLRSIGLAAVGDGTKLKSFSSKTLTRKPIPIVRRAPKPPVQVEKAPIPPGVKRNFVLTAVLGSGKVINLSIPPDFTGEDVAELVDRFHPLSKEGKL